MSIKSEKNFQLDFSLSIVIGLHNKEKDIEKTIRSIFNNIEATNLQLIVVENESTDNSYLIAKKLKQELSKPNFDFILLESKKGLGVALKEEYRVRNKRLYIFFRLTLPLASLN